MKKKFFVILMVTLLAISLIGCSDSKKSKEEKKQTEDIVGYDDGELKFTSTKMGFDEKGGFTINLTIENISDGHHYYINTKDACLNNCYHASINESEYDIASGETIKDKIYISPEQIAQYEIKDISKVDLLVKTKHMTTQYIQCSFLTHGEEMDVEKPSEPKGQCFLDNDYCTVYVERVETENGVLLTFDTRSKSKDLIEVNKSIYLYDANGKAADYIDASGNMIDYILKVDVPGLDMDRGQLLLPGSVDKMTYSCKGMINDYNLGGVIESNDVDLSMIHVTINMRNARNEYSQVTTEEFTVTK